MKHLYAILCLSLIAASTLFSDTTSPIDLGEILVRGQSLSKYHVDSVNSATYFNAPAEEIPISVDTLTEDFIREQTPTDLHNLLFYQPGISGGGKSLNDRTSGQYSIRGRSGTTPTLNGSLPMTSAMGIFLDPNALEGIEIAKGPIGALQGGQTTTLGPYGAGGSISLMLKQATFDETFTDLAFTFTGAKNAQKYRATADINEIHSDTLAFRLPLSFETSTAFWLPSGHDWRTSIFLAPSLAWEPTANLRFGLNTTFQYTDEPSYQGVPMFRGKPLSPYAWDDYFPGNNDLRSEYTGYSVQGFVEWDASDVWNFKAGAGYAGSDVDMVQIGPGAYADTKVTHPKMKAFNLNFSEGHSDVFNVFGRSIATYDAFGMSHITLFQADLNNQKDHSRSAGPAGNSLKSISDYNPNFARGDFEDSALMRMGALAQHYIEVGLFRFLSGIRYDKHESDLDNTANSISPRVGIAYVPTDYLTLYANFSRTEAPNFGYKESKNKELTSSWNANQVETGIRFSPVQDLWLTLAYYYIDSKNAPSYDDATGYYTTDADSENQGIEVSLKGDILENWSISLGYAYNDRMTPSNEKDFDSVPPHSASLQSTYKFVNGILEDFVVGIGYRYKHGYDGTSKGNYVGPDYYFEDIHLFDCSAEVPLSKFGGSEDWTFKIAIKNVFDENYFESNRHYYQCFTGDPRTIELTLRGRF